MSRLTVVVAALLSLSAAPAHAADGEAGWSRIVFHAINAAVLFFVIYKLAGPKVVAGLQSRSKQVAKDIDEATRLRSEAQARLAAAEADLAGLQAKADALLAELRREGEAERDRMIVEAKAEAERIRLEAERTAQSEIARARARLEVELGELAIEAATRTFKEKITPADHRRLAGEYLIRLEERS